MFNLVDGMPIKPWVKAADICEVFVVDIFCDDFYLRIESQVE